MTLAPSTRAKQRGGFALGLIVGLLIGLALALAVALYVTKVPVPFVNKVPQRTAEQDAAEAERNKSWDPNAPLSGKQAPRGAAGAAGAASAPAAPPTGPAAPVTRPAATPDIAPPAVVGRPTPQAAAPAGTASAPAKFGTDPFTYFVQAGAYQRPEEAEQQRAKLAMLGFAAKVTEREQSGRTVYRVRLGPYDKKEDADTAKTRLEGNGVEAALVRVQK